MDANTKRKAIAYWEKRRIVYNALLVPASLLAWQISKEFTYHIDDQTPARLTDPAVMLVLEFFFLAVEPRRFWPAPGRTLTLCRSLRGDCAVGRRRR
jgi:hypothetical protein